MALHASLTPLPTDAPHASPTNIWRIDYNATAAKEAAMGWQGLGYVFGLNAMMFLTAFAIFQRYGNSSQFSLFRFHTSSPLVPAPAATASSPSSSPPSPSHPPKPSKPHRHDAFTLRKWVELLWHTPIRDTDVERQLGPEGTFYLLYELYTCKLLAALSVYAFSILLPLYLSLGMRHTSSADDVAAAVGNGKSDDSPTLLPLALAALNSSMSVPPAAAATALLPPLTTDKWWSFTHATIRSIPNESPFLWVPVATIYVFTFAFALLLRKLSQLSSIPSSASARALSMHQLPHLTIANEHDALLSHAAVQATAATPLPATDRLHLIGMQPSDLSLRSLFINRGLPKTLREERFLYLMHEVFPQYVEDVSVVLDMGAFHQHQHARIAAETALERLQLLVDAQQQPRKWSLWLFPGSMKLPHLHKLFSWRRAPNALEIQALQKRVAALRATEHACLQRLVFENNGAGRAFLIFKTARLRARFVRRVKNQSIMSILQKFNEQKLPRMVRYVRELGITRWHLATAPEPDDVDWHSVAFPFVKRSVVVVLVNVAILLLLFLFTSPIAVTSAIASTQSYTAAASSVSDFVARVQVQIEKLSPQMAKMMVSYVPTLVLIVINSVLLNVLQIAGRIQPIATDSAKERLILRTASVYLIFNTIFVPSLAFVSIDAVLLYLNSDDGEVLDLLGTLFLHNSGIFYVYYVLQRAFLGTAVTLLRVSEYAKFSWEKPRAVTPREHVEAVAAWPFFTGTQMAIQISMVTVVLTFSTVVPLILPIGAVYFAMQFAVDKYALLLVRPRIKGRGSIARTATHATVVSLLMYQMAMSGFFIVRGTKLQSTSVLALLMLTYILALWWYVRDKERAFAQTTKGHSSGGSALAEQVCHHPHHRHHKRQQEAPVKRLADAVALVVEHEGHEATDAVVVTVDSVDPTVVSSLVHGDAMDKSDDRRATPSDGSWSIDEPEPPMHQLHLQSDDLTTSLVQPPMIHLTPMKASLRNDTSALLLLAAQREAVTADVYENESDLYREPALRRRKQLRAPIRSCDSRVVAGIAAVAPPTDQSYGSLWRHFRNAATSVTGTTTTTAATGDVPRSPAPATIPEEQ